MPSGLDCLLTGLAEGLDVRRGRAVTAVRALASGGVRIDVAGGGRLLADHAIVTAPLGVLKAGDLRFDPPPPRALRDAIARLGFGQALKARSGRAVGAHWAHSKHAVST